MSATPQVIRAMLKKLQIKTPGKFYFRVETVNE
jgi:hypothetical protein